MPSDLSPSAPAKSPAVAMSGKPPGQVFRVQLGRIIFLSRWLQMPLYLGLIIVQGIYVYRFLSELWHLIGNAVSFSETQIMLAVLGLIDVVMIANLLVMVIVGGYETFVSRLHLEGHPDQPEWLNHVNAGVLKVKLAMALIGISSIHLLQTFIAAGETVTIGGVKHEITSQSATIQVCIHLTFLVSALALAWTDRLTTPSHGENHHPAERRASNVRHDDQPEDNQPAAHLSPGDSMM